MWTNAFTVLLAILLVYLLYAVFRVYLLRRFYEKQGIPFVKSYAIIGAELQVFKLYQKNKSHDHAYIQNIQLPTDLVGTIRGLTVQLYGTSREVSEKLIHQTGVYLDRDTPAVFSFGRLGPDAIAFAPYSEYFFKQRKMALIRATGDSKRLFHIASRHAQDLLTQFRVENGTGQIIDVFELLNHFTRRTSGDFVWGKNTVNRSVEVLNSNDKMEYMSFMDALNETFTELRFYSNKLWNRIYFPLSVWPITREARRLTFNTKVIRNEIDQMMKYPEKNSVSEAVQIDNAKYGVPLNMTRDDLITSTIAGLDTIKSTIMSTMWHLLNEDNMKWREMVLAEITPILENSENAYTELAHCKVLNAVIYEALRFETPGSLINNYATKDYDLIVREKTYKIKAGTRIVPNIHVLHYTEPCWPEYNTIPLDVFDPSRFIGHDKEIVGSCYYMPFGKGPRRCPGQAVGMLMVRVFVAIFLARNFKCHITIPQDQANDVTYFNLSSRATFSIHCNTEN
ncbi:cytochrome P450 [Gigaspora margarita]|uniref:Cytochrome P450 n=1 Tax=Gigaspora margarita TaxID=4874 RepID=A0A8H4AFW1_GIGMA|nr:cytochrome P450 [Gigaspora margarita]